MGSVVGLSIMSSLASKMVSGILEECRRTLPKVALEADTLSSELWAVRSGVGSIILPAGDMSQFRSGAFAKPVLIEPPMVLSCSIIHSGSLPLTSAATAVHDLLIAYIKRRIHEMDMPGTEWVGDI